MRKTLLFVCAFALFIGVNSAKAALTRANEFDSIVYGGNKWIPAGTPAIDLYPHKFNSFRISFIAPFYENNDKIIYSCYLQGFDKQWSAWGPNTI